MPTDLNLALGTATTISGGYEKWNILGNFTRLNYAYDDRYLLEFTGRYDGSSKFPKDQRFAFFPSVSGAWRVSQEPFWKVSPKLVNDLRVRASWGSMGNGNVGAYQFQQTFGISQSGVIVNGTRPLQTRAPAVLPDGLTWETATTTNVGLDVDMFYNRLTFSGDVYTRKTTDMYTIAVTPPAVFGASAPRGNYADLATKGWELSLGGRMDSISPASRDTTASASPSPTIMRKSSSTTTRTGCSATIASGSRSARSGDTSPKASSWIRRRSSATPIRAFSRRTATRGGVPAISNSRI